MVKRLVVLMALSLFVVPMTGCGQKVTYSDLYKESVHAAVACSNGVTEYKPKKKGVTITAQKTRVTPTAPAGSLVAPAPVEAIEVSASEQSKKGTLVLHMTVPLTFLTPGSKEFASLDKEFAAIENCMQKAIAKKAANPPTTSNTCQESSLTYDGHPGSTMNDPVNAPHMELWIYNPNKTVSN